MDCIVRLGNGRAIGKARVSVFVIRAFVKMRETLLGTRELAKKLAALEKKLTSDWTCTKPLSLRSYRS
jgi:hypothetical protein